MSSAQSNFAQRSAAALQNINGERSHDGPSEPNDTDRLTTLLEAATATFDASEPGAVEAVFAVQALSLDVIFKDFIRRHMFTFDNMRVALRAQAQCRATFKALNDYRNPRRRPRLLRKRKIRRADY